MFDVSTVPEESVKVASLKPDLHHLNLTVKIVNVGPSRTIPTVRRDQRQRFVAEALVGDETGSVVLTLWEDQIGRFKPQDVIEIRSGYTTLFRGSLRLNSGRGGRIEKTGKGIEQVNTKNNLSEKTHIQIPWHLSESRPFRAKRRR